MVNKSQVSVGKFKIRAPPNFGNRKSNSASIKSLVQRSHNLILEGGGGGHLTFHFVKFPLAGFCFSGIPYKISHVSNKQSNMVKHNTNVTIVALISLVAANTKQPMIENMNAEDIKYMTSLLCTT